MTDYIDCLFIGPNKMDVKTLRNTLLELLGEDHPAFTNFNIDMLQYKEKLFLVEDLFNELIKSDDLSGYNIEPITEAGDVNAAIAYLGTYLNRRGFTFDQVSSFRDEKDKLVEKLKKNRYRAIALTTTMNYMPEPINEVVQFVRNYNRDTPIIAGGKFVAQAFDDMYRDTLPSRFDAIGADYYVNSKQGETTLVNFLSALKNRESLETVPNLCYKSGDRYVENTIMLEENKIADNLVDWTLFRNDLNYYTFLKTSVSCPFNCSFCTYPLHSGKYQNIGVEGIEYELNQLKKTNVKYFLFSDDTMNVPIERFKAILRMMIRNKYDFKWISYLRCQYTDEETAQLLKESGCQIVILGLESGSNQILKNMNKKVTVEQYIPALKLLKDAGIYIIGSFIFGFPGETEQTMAESLKLIKMIDFFTPNQWIAEIGAPIASEKKKYGIIMDDPFDWSHNTMEARTAANTVRKLVATVRETARLPLWDSNILFFIDLAKRGMTLEQIKKFMILYNRAISLNINGNQNMADMESIMDQMKALIKLSAGNIEQAA